MSDGDILFMTSRQLRLGRCHRHFECKTLDLKALLNKNHKDIIYCEVKVRTVLAHLSCFISW